MNTFENFSKFPEIGSTIAEKRSVIYNQGTLEPAHTHNFENAHSRDVMDKSMETEGIFHKAINFVKKVVKDLKKIAEVATSIASVVKCIGSLFGKMSRKRRKSAI